MTELELVLIRQQEHEIASYELQMKVAQLEGDRTSFAMAEMVYKLAVLGKDALLKRLEQQGHDYLTITAEMARIRAEVRGEK